MKKLWYNIKNSNILGDIHMKKLLAFSAGILLCLLLCVSAFAADKTVYIAAAGDDANGGTSYTDAVKTVERAYALLGDADGKCRKYQNDGGRYAFKRSSHP